MVTCQGLDPVHVAVILFKSIYDYCHVLDTFGAIVFNSIMLKDSLSLPLGIVSVNSRYALFFFLPRNQYSIELLFQHAFTFSSLIPAEINLNSNRIILSQPLGLLNNDLLLPCPIKYFHQTECREICYL